MLSKRRTSLLYLVVFYAANESFATAAAALISSMNSRILRAAHRYCALSNLGKLDCIREMIDPDVACIYGISGIDDIMKGIEGFHVKHHDVFWIFKTIKEDNDSYKVEIDFDRYWTERGSTNDSLNVYSCSASEIIEFNGKVQISSIIYKMRPTDTVFFGHEYPKERSVVLSEAKNFIESFS